MPTLTDPAVIKELLQRHGFSLFPARWGRIFIINPGVCPKMAELGGAAPVWGCWRSDRLWRADGGAVPPGGKGGGDRAG